MSSNPVHAEVNSIQHYVISQWLATGGGSCSLHQYVTEIFLNVALNTKTKPNCVAQCNALLKARVWWNGILFVMEGKFESYVNFTIDFIVLIDCISCGSIFCLLFPIWFVCVFELFSPLYNKYLLYIDTLHNSLMTTIHHCVWLVWHVQWWSLGVAVWNSYVSYLLILSSKVNQCFCWNPYWYITVVYIVLNYVFFSAYAY